MNTHPSFPATIRMTTLPRSASVVIASASEVARTTSTPSTLDLASRQCAQYSRGFAGVARGGAGADSGRGAGVGATAKRWWQYRHTLTADFTLSAQSGHTFVGSSAGIKNWIYSSTAKIPRTAPRSVPSTWDSPLKRAALLPIAPPMSIHPKPMNNCVRNSPMMGGECTTKGEGTA